MDSPSSLLPLNLNGDVFPSLSSFVPWLVALTSFLTRCLVESLVFSKEPLRTCLYAVHFIDGGSLQFSIRECFPNYPLLEMLSPSRALLDCISTRLEGHYPGRASLVHVLQEVPLLGGGKRENTTNRSRSPNQH